MNGRTRTIAAHAMDYELYRAEAARHHAVTDTAVFLDEYLPFHPDIAMMGVDAPMEADAYFACLRALFDRIEDGLGIEVVIAANPRSDYDDHAGVFGKRRVEKGATLRLVAESRLVIAHRSTAIGFAVLFDKPVLLTATRETYRHSSQTPYFDGFAAALDRPIQYFDDPSEVDLTHALDRDPAVYQRYVHDYIKQRGSADAPFWAIVADEIAASGDLAL